LELETDLVHIEGASHISVETKSVLSFEDVDFGYPGGALVLHDINFALEKGKTYALVGPTGGGKTTTASLMARLYDPTQGTVLLHGKDIRTYSSEERAKKIGFILQEPFLFGGTLKDNIFYGTESATTITTNAAKTMLAEAGFDELLSRFEQGLDTPISTGGESISLGQRQLIAFIRAVLRKPDILILDEATANVDTVTEEMLQKVLDALPKETTLVVIAHRLHTIAKADEIFFVNGGEIVNAGSMEHAVDMLMHGKRKT
jgi:ATP-binding cassette subfamily B protein